MGILAATLLPAVLAAAGCGALAAPPAPWSGWDRRGPAACSPRPALTRARGCARCFDAQGRPLVEQAPTGGAGALTVSAVNPDGTLAVVWSGSGGWVGRTTIADGHGTWLETASGIYLAPPGAPVQLAAAGDPGHPAGPCS